MIKCAWCLERLPESEFRGETDEETRRPICVECVAGDDIFLENGIEEEGGVNYDYSYGDFMRDMAAATLDADSIRDNPGNVAGENSFSVDQDEATEMIWLNEMVKKLLEIQYEEAPEGSTGEAFHDWAISAVDNVSRLVNGYLLHKDVSQRIGTLIVTDSATAEGGPDATGYLGTLKILYPLLDSLRRRYAQGVPGGLEAEKKATNDVHRVSYRIYSLITKGRLGAKEWKLTERQEERRKKRGL